MGEILSRRPAIVKLLALIDKDEIAIVSSILEVRVETALLNDQSIQTKFHFFLITVICFTMISVLLFCLFLVRRRNAYLSDSATNTVIDASRHEEEKSNNLQNEENFRRYANPLKGSTSSVKGVVELNLNQCSDLNPQPRAGPSGLHRSQQYLSTCEFEYDVGENDQKQQSKRTSQVLLQKMPNTEMTRNMNGMSDVKAIEKTPLSIHGTVLSSSDSNLLTIQI